MTLNTASRPTVLVVEPDPDTCELYTEWFNVGGFAVVTAGDAESALALYAQRQPSAVVTEIRLQPFDGFELLGRLKSLPGAQRVPVVVVTSQADARTLMRALVAGATRQSRSRATSSSSARSSPPRWPASGRGSAAADGRQRASKDSGRRSIRSCRCVCRRRRAPRCARSRRRRGGRCGAC